MKDPLQMLAEDMNVDASFRRILAGKPISPATGQFAMQDREQLIAGIEGALRVLEGPEPYIPAAVSILKGALRK